MGRTQQTACISDGDRTRRRIAAYEAYAQQRQAQAREQGLNELTEAELEASAPVNVVYDVSFDSSIYAHYFQAQATKTEVLLPSFAAARTTNPLENDDRTVEHWLSMNLNSCYDGPGIALNHAKLELVITLDVSGSMRDRFKGEPGKSKIQIAQQSLLSLLKQLSPDDSLGIVLFNGDPTVLHPITKVSSIDQQKLKEDILQLRAGGGTEISKAVKCATGLYRARNPNEEQTNEQNISRRIFFLTDMEVSHEDGQEFLKLIQSNAEKEQIWSTVVGVGLDLGTEVILTVSRTIGCNYCNVRNAQTFDQLMNSQFRYTVTPVGFHILLKLIGERYRLGQGYGSPEVYQYEEPVQSRPSVELVSEFALPMNDQNEVRGGYLLFQIIDSNKGDKDHEPLKLNTSWQTLNGAKESNDQEVQFPEQINSFTHSGIRKALLLVRYTKFIKRYLKVRQASSTPDIMEEYQTLRGQLPRLVEHFQQEMITLNDRSLYREEYQHLLDIAQKDDVPLNQNLLQTATLALLGEETAIPSRPAMNTPDRCCICLTNRSSVILTPCGHQCLCSTCLDEQLTRCPLCRQDITSTMEQPQA